MIKPQKRLRVRKKHGKQLMPLYQASYQMSNPRADDVRKRFRAGVLFCHFGWQYEYPERKDSKLIFQAIIWHYGTVVVESTVDHYVDDIRESLDEIEVRRLIKVLYPGIENKQSKQFRTGLHPERAPEVEWDNG
jgi:hypothetical protein